MAHVVLSHTCNTIWCLYGGREAFPKNNSVLVLRRSLCVCIGALVLLLADNYILCRAVKIRARAYKEKEHLKLFRIKN